ncbi:hypothetical protein NEHOM01_0620 [Nematocida homosporus]|uniref:uncharacterized protein n=1 Tax=Nematocida homosporus TaxID=1912981 RepID=UPI00221E4485|nr:uncharacterized protein NEHOM01_0620 [Nematocida homosporus]KAI5185115.1 hypothetical protein NEHOM01_0620 [Nematocida homosporus]
MQVLYRFKSEKEFSRIETDRSSMPLWELRAEIVSLRHLTLHDYHLVFYLENESTPVTDNYTTIHSNTKVLVERVPTYMQVGVKEALEKSKEKGDNEAGDKRGEEGRSSISVPSTFSARIPPPNYICFRCGEKGHYIQMCPTNSNKQYDAMRVKKATGIPKTFLVPAEESTFSVLLNEEGKFVRAQPQTREFSKHFGAGSRSRTVPVAFKCGQCLGLLADAMALECGHSVCEYCVGNRCPVCHKRVGRVIPDIRLRKSIERYLENDK